MPPKAKVANGPKRARSAPKAHKLAEEFPPGMMLRDMCKKEWLLGKVVGQGGFGLIYLASDNTSRTVDPKTAGYVIKIEPKGNGPLFCEIHFYQRAAKQSSIAAFMGRHRLRYLGIPAYTGAGLAMHKSQEYRFLVMPRFGKDLQKLLEDCGGKFSPPVTFAVGLRMVDALQFLHENEYVHADIKAANILLGFSKGSDVKNEVYLVDYGLAYRYTVGSEHKNYKEDKRRAHNGTITFTSRDAHRGLAPSRRGDMEILGYCMLQWLSGKLPWENNLTDPSYVAGKKESFMANVRVSVADCISSKSVVSGCMSKYFESVNSLHYDSEPNYNEIRDILKSGLTGSGQKDEWKIEFTQKAKGLKRTSTDASDGSPAKRMLKSPLAEGKQASPGRAQSPYSRKSLLPSGSKVSPPIPATKTNATAAKTAGATNGNKKSPGSLRVGSAQPRGGAKVYASGKPKKNFPMPAPTPLTPTASKEPTRRRVKRTTVAKSDMSAQTTPGLSKNV